jgi:hypothetical protein
VQRQRRRLEVITGRRAPAGGPRGRRAGCGRGGRCAASTSRRGGRAGPVAGCTGATCSAGRCQCCLRGAPRSLRGPPWRRRRRRRHALGEDPPVLVQVVELVERVDEATHGLCIRRTADQVADQGARQGSRSGLPGNWSPVSAAPSRSEHPASTFGVTPPTWRVRRGGPDLRLLFAEKTPESPPGPDASHRCRSRERTRATRSPRAGLDPSLPRRRQRLQSHPLRPLPCAPR